MVKVYPGLFVGGEWDCVDGTPDKVVIHACKHPCHQNAVGYSPSKEHENYLSLQTDFDLYLNIIDPPYPLFMPGTFEVFLKFTKHHWGLEREVLIHCNQGKSRAPSLAMLFLAEMGIIANKSYNQARDSFNFKYSPAQGIEIYLDTHWEEILGTKD